MLTLLFKDLYGGTMKKSRSHRALMINSNDFSLNHSWLIDELEIDEIERV